MALRIAADKRERNFSVLIIYIIIGCRNSEVTSTKLRSPLRRQFTITSCVSSPILVPVERSISCRITEELEKSGTALFENS
jgi:hypothetical protein